jgi:hypothetical protein
MTLVYHFLKNYSLMVMIMMELGTYLDKLAATIVHFSNLLAFTYIACSMLCTNKVMLLYFHDF